MNGREMRSLIVSAICPNCRGPLGPGELVTENGVVWPDAGVSFMHYAAERRDCTACSIRWSACREIRYFDGHSDRPGQVEAESS